MIFKNQARGISETPKREFVNDLLRTEFHKRFMKLVSLCIHLSKSGVADDLVMLCRKFIA